MARGWPPVSEILERSGEGEEGTFGRLLLLEWRTAAGCGLPAVVRDGRDSNGVGRARVGVLDHSCGEAPRSGRADVRCLLARGFSGYEHPGRTRRSEACKVDRRADEPLEVDQECLDQRPKSARNYSRPPALPC